MLFAYSLLRDEGPPTFVTFDRGVDLNHWTDANKGIFCRQESLKSSY